MPLVNKTSVYAPTVLPVDDVFANPKLETQNSIYDNIQAEDVYASPKPLIKKVPDSPYGLDHKKIKKYAP